MTGDRLIATFREKRTHQAIVIDAQARVVGIVSLDDLLTDLLGTKDDATPRRGRISAGSARGRGSTTASSRGRRKGPASHGRADPHRSSSPC